MNTAGSKPFFSIGVTTYDRPALLKETLESITRQTFTDFEILVGNDNPGNKLSGELLGIDDSRISFINRPSNLGELGNMNALLDAGRGRYFTWLADDDLYFPGFLQAIHCMLEQHGPFDCVFTNFAVGDQYPMNVNIVCDRSHFKILKGEQFLERYLDRSLNVIGCYGVFDTNYLRQIGGIKHLGNGFSPYADNLLAVQAAKNARIGYVDSPLVFFRTHSGSISLTSPDVYAYSSAQEDFLLRSMDVFRDEGVAGDDQLYLFLLLKWCIRDFATVVQRSGAIRIGTLHEYFLVIAPYVRRLQGTPYCIRIIGVMAKTFLGLSKHFIKKALRQR